MLDTVVDIHTTQPTGDVLVFLTGQEEIDTLVQLLKDKAAELLQASNYKGAFETYSTLYITLLKLLTRFFLIRQA